MDRQRIDKWLWHARVVRTRTAAADLVDSGRVRVNGARIDAASRAVRAGDVVTVALDHIRILKVTGFSERRGSAPQAAALFKDLQPRRIAPAEQPSSDEPAGRRPSKRERQDIVRLKRPDTG